MDDLGLSTFLKLAVVMAVTAALVKLLAGKDFAESFKVKGNGFKMPSFINDFIVKLKSQLKTTKGKVIAGVGIFLMIGLTYENNRVKADPCGCYEVFQAYEIQGWNGMSYDRKVQYNTCITDWDNSRRANNGCLRSLGVR